MGSHHCYKPKLPTIQNTQETKSDFDTLKVDTLHLKINRDSREFKVLQLLSEESGVSSDEMECYLECFPSLFVFSQKEYF